LIDDKIDLSSVVNKNIFDENIFNIGMAYNEWVVGEEITGTLPNRKKILSKKKKKVKEGDIRLGERTSSRRRRGRAPPKDLAELRYITDEDTDTD